jgi:hypothetical protein
MAILSSIITPTNVLTATSTNTVTNKTISGANNTITNVSLTTGVTGTLPVANGGTGQTTQQNAINALAGAVTSASYLRGNGTNVVMSAIQAADVPTLNQNTTGTASNVTGTVAVANGGTGATTLTANNVLLGNGTSALQVVAPGTTGNLLTSNGTTWTSAAGLSLAGDNTWTGTQTFSGTASKLGMVLNDAAEVTTISAIAATGTINFDVTTQSVLYYTSNASGNWTLNVRASSGTTLNTVMATGQSVTIAFIVTNGATAFRQTGFQVDGSAVTPRWQGGTAPAAGNASSLDAYVITIIKTGAATFTALASQTRFA